MYGRVLVGNDCLLSIYQREMEIVLILKPSRSTVTSYIIVNNNAHYSYSYVPTTLNNINWTFDKSSLGNVVSQIFLILMNK